MILPTIFLSSPKTRGGSLWNPTPFLTGCSQAAVLDGGPALIRNYDWDYRVFDGVVARTGYTGRRVLGNVDRLWGLLDGVNDAGLAISLTFGGRPRSARASASRW